MMNLIKDGKLTPQSALLWAKERAKNEQMPKLTNEQQLELLNKVKLGRMTIDEALSAAATQVWLLSGHSERAIHDPKSSASPSATPLASPTKMSDKPEDNFEVG